MTLRLTSADLARLQQQEQQATKGPWELRVYKDVRTFDANAARVFKEPSPTVRAVAIPSGSPNGFIWITTACEPNAEFIAAMRNALPELLSGYARALALEGMRHDIEVQLDVVSDGGTRRSTITTLLRDLLAALDKEPTT